MKVSSMRSTKDRLSYAYRYAHILQKGDAQELLALNNDKRIHATKSLSAFEKYTGCYDRWKQIQ